MIQPQYKNITLPFGRILNFEIFKGIPPPNGPKLLGIFFIITYFLFEDKNKKKL